MRNYKYNDEFRNYYDEEIPYDPKPWHIFLIISAIVTLGIGMIYGINKAFFKSENTQGTVISHTVTADKYGEATYHTIARFEDGCIRDLHGLNNYVKPVGGTVIYTHSVLK